MAARLLKSQARDSSGEVTVTSYASHDIDRRCFGERALLQAVPRQASVVLRSACVLYAMSRRHFRAALRHTRAVDVLGALRKFGWFGSLPDSDLRALRDTMIERTFEDGEVVVRQGEKADTAFVIISGFARVTQQPENLDERPVELPGYLSQSTCFGDTMLLPDGVRGATVIAAGTLRCMQLTRTALLLQLDETVLEQGYAKSVQAAQKGQWKAQGLNRSTVYSEPALHHLP
jgi:CRP-like cAMP-binding protein